MYKRVIGLATAAAVAMSIAPALAFAGRVNAITVTSTPAPQVEGTTFELPPVLSDGETTSTPSTDSTTTVTAKPKYRPMPVLKKGVSKSYASKKMKAAGFKVQYKYTYGKKNTVQKTGVNRKFKKAPYRKWDSKNKRWVFREGVTRVIYLGNGKSAKPWKTGTATWYSIADNTPRGSRATSSGKLLGWNGGWTFASRNFPLGTKLRVKGPNGKIQTVICTDRGGLHTIDLYKPASDRLGMNGKSKFQYQVIGKAF